MGTGVRSHWAFPMFQIVTDDTLWLPLSRGFQPMNHEDNQDRERKLRERIASLMRSNEQARTKPITSEERQKLKSAANRLDQMLRSTADADRQTLNAAAARLDQFLSDIRKGKDITAKIKRRHDAQKTVQPAAPDSQTQQNNKG